MNPDYVPLGAEPPHTNTAVSSVQGMAPVLEDECLESSNTSERYVRCPRSLRWRAVQLAKPFDPVLAYGLPCRFRRGRFPLVVGKDEMFHPSWEGKSSFILMWEKSVPLWSSLLDIYFSPFREKVLLHLFKGVLADIFKNSVCDVFCAHVLLHSLYRIMFSQVSESLRKVGFDEYRAC